MTRELPNLFDCFTYHRLPLDDDEEEDISAVFEDAFQFIDAALEEEETRVLVHCRAGMSRSATIVIAWLMKRDAMSLRDAYLHVKLARPLICPNSAFMRALIALERELFGQVTVTVDVVERSKKLRVALQRRMRADAKAKEKAEAEAAAKKAAETREAAERAAGEAAEEPGGGSGSSGDFVLERGSSM
eukprot:PLAT4005.1.p1 GENE.PLAT4005.1~~PLAT4005.1.p1  ORF type:complete len:188 (+),score=66.76 PLAT4005.1:265-828(+)